MSTSLRGRDAWPETDEIAGSLARGGVAVFCGAGISFASGLPLARQLIDALLRALRLEPSQAEALATRLPFEAFIETLRSDTDAGALLRIFARGAPNRTHVLLARLMKAGRLATVCTVNFDELIERALEAEGLRAGTGYALAVSEDAFAAIAWSDAARPRLIKIHGSVADPESMAITLNQVASTVLSEQRRSVIEHVFSKGAHDDVLVLGYSASDAFDLTPHIETLAAHGKRIFFVEHAQGSAGRRTRISGDDASPFRNYPRAFRLAWDTDRLVDAMWAQAFGEPPPPAAVSAPVWHDLVDEWAMQFEPAPAARHAVKGQLLSRISLWDEAAVCFEEAIAVARPDNPRAAGYHSNAGIAYSHLAKFDIAIEHHNAGIAIARAHDDLGNEASNLQSLANLHTVCGRIEQALPLYRRAAALAEQMGNSEGIAATGAAIGMALARLGSEQEGYRHLQQALEFARSRGLVLAHARVQGDLGAFFLLQKKVPEAIEQYETSLALARKIGAKEVEGKALGNLGFAYLMKNDAAAARPYLDASLTVARALRNRLGEAQTLQTLGLYHELLGRRDESIDLYARARELGAAIGALQTVETASQGLSRVGTPQGAAGIGVMLDTHRPRPDAVSRALVAELLRLARCQKALLRFDAGHLICLLALLYHARAIPSWALIVLGVLSVALASVAFIAATRSEAWGRRIARLAAGSGVMTGPRQMRLFRLLLKATGCMILLGYGILVYAAHGRGGGL